MATEMGNDWDASHGGWRPRFAAYWREKQQKGTAQVFFAKLENETVGLAIASLIEDYHAAALGEPRGYVNGVYVAPAYRCRGVGRQLMLAALTWFRDRLCAVVRLRASDAGRSLYESLGFKAGHAGPSEEANLSRSMSSTSGFRRRGCTSGSRPPRTTRGRRGASSTCRACRKASTSAPSRPSSAGSRLSGPPGRCFGPSTYVEC